MVVKGWLRVYFVIFCYSVYTTRDYVTVACLLIGLLAVIRQEEMKNAADFDVVVASHQALFADGVFLRRRFVWRLVVVVEGHCLKSSEKAQLCQKLKQVRN